MSGDSMDEFSGYGEALDDPEFQDGIERLLEEGQYYTSEENREPVYTASLGSRDIGNGLILTGVYLAAGGGSEEIRMAGAGLAGLVAGIRTFDRFSPAEK